MKTKPNNQTKSLKHHNVHFRMLVFLILNVSFFNLLTAQEGSITNITVAQRTDGSRLVDVCYDLTGDENFSVFTITAEVSYDGGETYQSITMLTGDIGGDIAEGTGKCFVWDFGTEAGELYTANAKIRLTANSEELPPGSGEFNMVTVLAGDYTYGSGDEIRNIDYDYEIMKYEVTNAQYVVYLEGALATGDITVTSSTVQGYYEGDENYGAGEYEYLDLDDSDCRIDWTGSEVTIITGYEDHPVVEVSWFGAQAFAQFYGLRLPDEYEWEKAARGITGADYPWGENYGDNISDNANYWGSGDPWDNGTTPIGYFNGENGTTDSPSPYGAYDMAGNVWDWTHSWLSDGSSSRVIRGGSWDFSTSNLRSWIRNYFNPSYTSSAFGFRCSRTL